jgi:hypothetical protein
MPSAYKHPKTGVYWFRQRVPAQLRTTAKDQTVSVTIAGVTSHHKVGEMLQASLRTKEPAVAKERAQEAETQFDLVWARFGNGPVSRRQPHEKC